MKKTLAILTTLLLATVPASAVQAATAPTVKLNGAAVAFDVQPQVINDRTYVPFRKLLETLGAQVEWNETAQIATATKDGLTITIPLGSRTITAAGHQLVMDVQPVQINGRVLVPLRFAANALGAEVDWDAAAQQVDIKQGYDNMLNQIVSGSVSYDQAAILFEWLSLGNAKGELPEFTAYKPPTKNPFTGSTDYKYVPCVLKAPGVTEFFDAAKNKSSSGVVYGDLKRDFYAGKYRVVENRIYTKDGFEAIAYGVFDQTQWSFFQGEGRDIVAFLPPIN